MKDFFFLLKQESLQKTIYKLEEQLHNEMQLKDEMEQKCRWDCSSMMFSY